MGLKPVAVLAWFVFGNTQACHHWKRYCCKVKINPREHNQNKPHCSGTIPAPSPPLLILSFAIPLQSSSVVSTGSVNDTGCGSGTRLPWNSSANAAAKSSAWGCWTIFLPLIDRSKTRSVFHEICVSFVRKRCDFHVFLCCPWRFLISNLTCLRTSGSAVVRRFRQNPVKTSDR